MKHVMYSLNIHLRSGLFYTSFPSFFVSTQTWQFRSIYMKIKNFLRQIISFTRPHIFLDYSHKISTARKLVH